MKKCNNLILALCVSLLPLSVSAQEPIKIPPPLEGKTPPNILNQAQKLPVENLEIITASGNIYKYSTEIVLQGYNSTLTMLGGGNTGGGIQNDTTQQNTNTEDSSQVSNDMDDEIPF